MVSPPSTKDIINWRRGAGNDLKLIEVKVLEESAKNVYVLGMLGNGHHLHVYCINDTFGDNRLWI